MIAVGLPLPLHLLEQPGYAWRRAPNALVRPYVARTVRDRDAAPWRFYRPTKSPHTPGGRSILVYSEFDAGVVCHNCLMTELRDEVRPEPDHRQALERQIENVQKERRRQEGNRTIEEQERAYCTARSSL